MFHPGLNIFESLLTTFYLAHSCSFQLAHTESIWAAHVMCEVTKRNEPLCCSMVAQKPAKAERADAMVARAAPCHLISYIIGYFSG